MSIKRSKIQKNYSKLLSYKCKMNRKKPKDESEETEKDLSS